MMDINSVTLIGRLTRDPEQRSIKSGIVTSFSIAVNGYKETVSYIDVSCFGKTAEAVSMYCNKGQQVCVVGSLRQERWEDKEGKSRSKIGVTASQVQFIGGGKKKEVLGEDVTGQVDNPFSDEDIPF